MPRPPHLVSVLLLCAAASAARAETWELARWLPPGRLGVLRVDDGAGLDARLPRPLLDLWEPQGRLAGEWARYRASGGPEAARLLADLLDGRFEAALYERGHERLRDEHGGSLELLLVAAPRDPVRARRQLERWAADAEAAGQPVSRGNYRGTSYLRIGRGVVATFLGDHLALASDDDLLADAIDLDLDGDRRGLPEGPPAGGASLGFSPSLARGPQLALSAQLRRRFGVPAATLASLVLGPLDLSLQSDDWIVGTLVPEGAGLRLDLRLPGAPEAARDCWFPEDGAPARRPSSAGHLAALSLSRDLAAWWRQRQDLLPDDDQTRLARLDDDAGELLGGASLAEDLLSRAGHDLQLLFDRDPAGGAPQTCLLVPLEVDPCLADALVVAFQSALGLANLSRGADGRRAWLANTETTPGLRLVTTRAIAPLGLPGDVEPPEPTPCLALTDSHLLLGSGEGQVRRLVDDLAAGRQRAGDGPAHLAFELDCAELAAVGRDLRPLLVARTLLERGLSPDGAGETVDRWLVSLERLGALTLTVAPEHGLLHLRLATTGPRDTDRRAAEPGTTDDPATRDDTGSSATHSTGSDEADDTRAASTGSADTASEAAPGAAATPDDSETGR